MSVQIYGLIGKRCPGNQNCREFISNKYMFFLAFENSVCRDYITEKFFDTLKFDIVPVVLGGGNYSHYIPKSGFIDAMDFESPAELAKFLKYLSKNKEAYNKYFEWKKDVRYREKPLVQAYICEACIKLLLEEFSGIVENKKLIDMKNKFGMTQNCRGQQTRRSFNYVLGQYLKQTFVLNS